MPELDICYRAVSSRDARFDGWFVMGVQTTGIYCCCVLVCCAAFSWAR